MRRQGVLSIASLCVTQMSSNKADFEKANAEFASSFKHGDAALPPARSAAAVVCMWVPSTGCYFATCQLALARVTVWLCLKLPTYLSGVHNIRRDARLHPEKFLGVDIGALLLHVCPATFLAVALLCVYGSSSCIMCSAPLCVYDR